MKRRFAALVVSIATLSSNGFGINSKHSEPLALYVTPIVSFDDAVRGLDTPPRTAGSKADAPLLVASRAAAEDGTFL